MPAIPLSGAVDGATIKASPGANSILRVLGGHLSSAGALVTVQLKSGSDVIWESKALGYSPFEADIAVNPNVTIDTAPGADLKLGLSGGAVSGYIEVVGYGCGAGPGGT